MQFLWQNQSVDLKDLRFEVEIVVKEFLKISCEELWNFKEGVEMKNEEEILL